MMHVLEDLIAQKPHLRDMLLFYEKSLQFMETVRGLRIRSGPERSYNASLSYQLLP